MNPKTDNHKKGMTGEDIACLFLEGKGFEIVYRNYRKKWGELDIIARKVGKIASSSRSHIPIHFFEVKSVTVANFNHSTRAHRPEENVHPFKVRQISRMIRTYMAEQGRGLEAEFHFHVICVYMNLSTRRARIKWLEDVIL